MMSFVLMLYLSNNLFVIFGVSAAIMSTFFRTSIARKVISAKFPIGVDTIYNTPLTFLLSVKCEIIKFLH